MRAQTSGLCLLLSLLFTFWALAPHDVHYQTPQPAVTVTSPQTRTEGADRGLPRRDQHRHR